MSLRCYLSVTSKSTQSHEIDTDESCAEVFGGAGALGGERAGGFGLRYRRDKLKREVDFLVEVNASLVGPFPGTDQVPTPSKLC